MQTGAQLTLDEYEMIMNKKITDKKKEGDILSPSIALTNEQKISKSEFSSK